MLCATVATFGVLSSGWTLPARLLESFDNEPDPDAPGGTRDAILGDQGVHHTVPSGALGDPTSDSYYRHVYTGNPASAACGWVRWRQAQLGERVGHAAWPAVASVT